MRSLTNLFDFSFFASLDVLLDFFYLLLFLCDKKEEHVNYFINIASIASYVIIATTNVINAKSKWRNVKHHFVTTLLLKLN